MTILLNLVNNLTNRILCLAGRIPQLYFYHEKAHANTYRTLLRVPWGNREKQPTFVGSVRGKAFRDGIRPEGFWFL